VAQGWLAVATSELLPVPRLGVLRAEARLQAAVCRLLQVTPSDNGVVMSQLARQEGTASRGAPVPVG